MSLGLSLSACNGSLELKTKAEGCVKDGDEWLCRDERIDTPPRVCRSSDDFEGGYVCPQDYDRDFICTNERDYLRLQKEITDVLSELQQCKNNLRRSRF